MTESTTGAKLRIIADAIEREPDRFDMTDFGRGVSLKENKCGTVGCIAGWATSLFSPMPPNEFDPDEDPDTEREARFVLGLDCGEADHLFQGAWSPNNGIYATAAEAVAYLRKLADAMREAE